MAAESRHSHDSADSESDCAMMDSNGNVHSRADGASIIQVNQLSTPVLLILVIGMALLGVLSGVALGRSEQAINMAQIAEREGRLAEEAAMHLRSTMRAYGISINQDGVQAGIKDDLDQEEPVEP